MRFIIRQCLVCKKVSEASFCGYDCEFKYKLDRARADREMRERIAFGEKKRGMKKKKKWRKPKRQRTPHDFGPRDPFYRSKEWRKVRYLAIRQHGKKCTCCGVVITDRVHVDHIKPRSKFPRLALCVTNLQVLCEDCNVGKGNWDETDWRPNSPPPSSENSPTLPRRD